MSLIFILLMVLSYIAGMLLARSATDIAIRRGTNVWTASRPELGAALLFYALSLLFGIAANTSLASAAVDPPAGPTQVIHITDDPGGSVADYYRKYQALSNAGTEIHFHGICASACTMVLFTEFTGIKACADEGAVFAFHKPFAEKEGKVMRSKKAAREARKIWTAWLEELPPPLRRYLKGAHVPSAAEGDEQNTLLLLPANILLPKCPMTVAAQ